MLGADLAGSAHPMASPEPPARAKGAPPLAYETILYEENGPIGTLTLNRPDDGNMFTATML